MLVELSFDGEFVSVTEGESDPVICVNVTNGIPAEDVVVTVTATSADATLGS